MCTVALFMLAFLSAAPSLVERHAAVDGGVLMLCLGLFMLRWCPDSNCTPVPFGLGFLLLKTTCGAFFGTKFLFTFRVTHQNTASTLMLGLTY